MSDAGNSNRITREYLDSLLIETRYLDSTTPNLDFRLFGKDFASPIMTAALSHLDHFMFPGAAVSLARGAAETHTVLWYGMADESEIEHLASFSTDIIEIIKPYADRDIIFRKIEHAAGLGLLAVGIDIDHAFSADGSYDTVDGFVMSPLQTSELETFCKQFSLPVIVKGILSVRDAERALGAGAAGLVLSHHNNRIGYAVPPLAVLPDIVNAVQGSAPVFVDCEIQTGMDAFKALALGASGVCIGRPLMTAIRQDPESGVRVYLENANRELAKAMAFTCCTNLHKMDPTVIHRL